MLHIKPDGLDKKKPNRTFKYKFSQVCVSCGTINDFEVKLTVNIGANFIFGFSSVCAVKSCKKPMTAMSSGGPVS